MNSPAVNNATSALITRNVEPSLTGRFNETFPIATLQAHQLFYLQATYVFIFAYGTLIAAVFGVVLSRHGPCRLWKSLNRLDRFRIFARTRELLEDRIGTKGISYIIRFMLFWSLLSNCCVWVYVLDYQLKFDSWSATSGFLDTCKTKQVCLRRKHEMRV
jgi:hypothetical protein